MPIRFVDTLHYLLTKAHLLGFLNVCFIFINHNLMLPMSHRTYFSIPLVMFVAFAQAQNSPFELVPSSKTSITFSNNVSENVSNSENLFDYDYFYNGSGVGVLDVNNDGLQDIYFAGNQEENTLYLNQGDFKFKDITSTAFSGTTTNWSTGVSIVDINGDGWQDIYVSQGGPFNPEERRNLLYINQQDNSFVESAQEYGLADEGMSTQAVFFDFDHDGDKDCFVMNESIAYGMDPVTFTRLNLERRSELYISYSHMYINEDGVFRDATKELQLNDPTFGLGLKVADFNQDGWKDLYISNDYYVPDMMLINQQGSGFKNQITDYLKQMSFYGMGMDIADINNDGHSDIFVLDMASGDHYRSKTLMRSMNVENFRLLVDGLQLPYQYMFNSLQLNNGNDTYSNVSQLAGISSTDWSWSVLVEDFDFDGMKDVHVTNGYRRYALDNDFQAKIRAAKAQYNNQVPLDIKQDLYNQMPTEKLANVFYKNMGNLNFETWDVGNNNNPPSYSHGAAIADFDNDGDPDMVVNNLDDEAFMYRNTTVEVGSNHFITIKQNALNQCNIEQIQLSIGHDILSYEPSVVRGYLSSSEPSVFIGLGDHEQIDQITVTWDNGTSTLLSNPQVNSVIRLDYDEQDVASLAKSNPVNTRFKAVNSAALGIEYTHEENLYDDFESEILLPYKQSTLGPDLTVADFSGDGLQDILFSNSRGQPIKLFYQTTKGFEQLALEGELNCTDQEIARMTLADINDDGYQDILMPASGNEEIDYTDYYQSKILIGNSNMTFTTRDLPLSSGSTSRLIALDIDQDGDKDIIECKRHVAQRYPKHASSHVYQNDNNEFADITYKAFPDLADFGMVNDMLVTDFSGDGIEDVIVIGEWSQIGFYQNVDGVFTSANDEYAIPRLMGMWYSIEESDLNNDGQPDYIVGNLGTNSKYKASKKKPLKIYGNDFDNNGTWDLVLSKQYKDDYVPLRGLECSSQQMPFIQEKFETYDLFAKATIDDVYGESLDSSYQRHIDMLSSIALISGSNTYNVVELPPEVQMFPVLDIEILDVNNDGNDDVILAGNIYDTEVETPRLDSGQGAVLVNDGHGNLTTMSKSESGLKLNYNIKSIESIYHSGLDEQLLFSVENNGPVRTFILTK